MRPLLSLVSAVLVSATPIEVLIPRSMFPPGALQFDRREDAVDCRNPANILWDVDSKGEKGNTVTNCENWKFKPEDGVCYGERKGGEGNGCLAYCETSVRKFPGREMPFGNSYCGPMFAPEGCALKKGQARTEERSYSINMNMGFELMKELTAKSVTGVFNAGASMEWKSSVTMTTEFEFTSPKGECGSFTFIPWMIESCGVQSQAPMKTSNGFLGLTPGNNNPPPTSTCNWAAGPKAFSTNSRYCNTLPLMEDNKVSGIVNFVLENCHGGGGAKQDGQFSLMYYPGVTARAGFKSTWPSPETALSRPLTTKAGDEEGKKSVKIALEGVKEKTPNPVFVKSTKPGR